MNPEFAPHELCVHCMQTIQNQHTCPHCGHDNRQYKPHPLYLKPYTLLQEQYVIGKSIGQGGFGITYIGIDIWLQKRVAIKEYMPSALATRDFISAIILPIKRQETAFQQGLQSFLYEARNLAKFDHPNIVKVHNFFEENQTGYMVMDYLEGQSLIDILMESNGRLTINQTLDIMLPILDALSIVHAEHIYHRDISPHNIFILTDGTPILIDFGAARHIVGENSRSLDLVLKHGYSPIEQYSGKGKIGAWTDIYACGALMYVMLVGNLPPAATDRFYEDSLISLKDFNLNIPDTIINTIERALHIKAEQRFQSVKTFRAALLGEELPEEIVVKPQSHFIKITIVLSILMTALLATVWNISQSNQIPLLQQQAQQYLQQQQTVLAYDTYQTILSQQPDNQQARQGLQQIVNFYEQQSQISYNKQEFSKAMKLIKQGLTLFPNNPVLFNLQQKTLAAIQTEKINNQIETLLQQARQNIAQQKYQAAYAQYQSILKLDKNQQDAKKGLENIAQFYLTQAQNEQQDIKQRLYIINKALGLFPQNIQFISLKQNLLAKQDKQQQIEKLLKKAEKQLNALYLTEPNDNNAYLTYQQLLQITPNHPDALAGLDNIADAYVKLANTEQQLAKRLDFVQKGLSVIPNHSELLRLKNRLEKQQAALTQEVKPIDITPEKPQPVQKIDVITPLLNQAQQQMNQQQYELAYRTYQQVLQQQNSNSTALAGLQKIGQNYELLARQQFEQQNYNQVNLWLNKGLALFPSHAGLLHLRERLKMAMQEPDEPPATEPPPVEEPVAEPEHNIIFTPSF